MKNNAINYHKITMRISTFFLVIVLGLHSLFATEIKGQTLKSSTILLHKNSYTLEELFKEISSETIYSFVTSKDVIDLGTQVNLDEEEQNLQELLEQLSLEHQLRFYRLNDLISVSKIQSKQPRAVAQVVEQLSVKGAVKDQQGVPLPGATIQVNQTNTGVATDFDGEFTGQAGVGDQFSVAYVGFESQTLVVGDKDYYEITLAQDVAQLEEGVVTAPGIKREEKKLGFSQETVKSEDLAQAVPVNWSSGLKGKVAGLNIVSAGSGPINSQQIILRGNSSFDLSGNYALVVVDGVPVNTEMTTSGSSSAYMGEDSPVDYGNGISDLNLDDIES